MAGLLHPNHRLGDPLPQRIAVVRSLPGLGDLLCVIPALRALRTALPNADITLIGLPWAKRIVQRFSHYLTTWLEFPGYPGLPEVPVVAHRVVTFLSHAQQLQFDFALQMHGNGSITNSFTVLLGAKHTAGFFPKGQFCPDSQYFLPYPEGEPEIRRHLRLMEFLGIPPQGEHLEFPLITADWQNWQSLASKYSLRQGSYICIHPGASTRDRCWSPQRFAIVADAIATQGLQVVLTGTAGEADITRAVAEAMRNPAINLAGHTSLGAIAVLLKQSRLLVCNDTGVSHLADALAVNSVVIFSNSDSKRWAPLDRQRHRVVESREWRNGAERSVTRLSPPTAAQVLAETETLLQQEVAHAV